MKSVDDLKPGETVPHPGGLAEHVITDENEAHQPTFQGGVK